MKRQTIIETANVTMHYYIEKDIAEMYCAFGKQFVKLRIDGNVIKEAGEKIAEIKLDKICGECLFNGDCTMQTDGLLEQFYDKKINKCPYKRT